METKGGKEEEVEEQSRSRWRRNTKVMIQYKIRVSFKIIIFLK